MMKLLHNFPTLNNLEIIHRHYLPRSVLATVARTMKQRNRLIVFMRKAYVTEYGCTVTGAVICKTT